MKRALVLVAMLTIISISGCKKCYECWATAGDKAFGTPGTKYCIEKGETDIYKNNPNCDPTK
jgi:hypothetical protein